MPNIAIALPEVDQSVSRPVIVDIVGQIQTITQIPKQAKIYFAGPMGKMQLPGSDVDGLDQNRDASFNTDRIIFIEVDEDFDQGSVRTTAVSQKEHIPVFEDPRLGVVLTPIYATSNVVINVKYRTNSSTEADRWLRDMRTRISMLRDVNLHRAKYHFGVPEEMLNRLTAIYDLREKVAPYGDSLGNYVRSHMTERLTLIGDQVGKNIALAISETQCRIQGLFEFEVVPDKPTKDVANGTYDVSFSYKFSYEKPISMEMRYPVSIHNQDMDPRYVAFSPKENDPVYVKKAFTKSLLAFNYFEMDTIMMNVRPPDPFVRIPYYDDYVLPQVPQGTGTAMLVLAYIEEDKRALFNLNELGDVCIDEDILDFIREVEWPYVCQQFKSVIHLTLYRNQYQQSSGSISCDKDLNITSESDLSYRDVHHVRLGLCVDLTLLPKQAIERLRNYPKVLVKILQSMNEVLRLHPDVGSLGQKSQLTPLEFSELYSVMTGYGYNNGVVGRPTGLYNRPVGKPSLLDKVDPRVLENYRKNMIAKKTIQISNIVAVKR